MTPKEKQLVQQLLDKIKKAFDYKKEWADQASDNIKKFMNGDWRKNKKKDFFVFIPLIYWAVSTKLARDLEPLYTPDKTLEVKPVEPNDEEKAELSEHLLNWQLKNTPDFKWKMWMLHLQKRVCGTSPYIVFQDYEIKDVKHHVEVNVLDRLRGETSTVRTEKVVKSFPNIEVIDFFDFYLEPGAESIKKAAYCGRKFKMKLKDLKDANKNKKEGEEKYINLDELQKALDDKNTNTTTTQEEGNVKPAPLSDDETMVEITDYYTDTKWCMISNDILIKNEDNPYWHGEKPYGALVNDPELNEFYGRGEPELGENINDLYNRMRRSRVLNAELVNSKIIMIKEGSNEKHKRWKFKPGAKWKVKNFNNIKELEISDLKYSSEKEIALLLSEYERVTFISGYQTGAASPSMNDTATGVSIISHEANKIFDIHRQLDEDMGIETIGDFYMKLNHQYMRRPQAVRILGEQGMEWINVRPQDVPVNYDIYTSGASKMVNKAAYLQQLIGLYQLFMQDPEVNQYEFKRRIIEAADLRGVDKILIKQPPIPPGPPGQLTIPGMTPPGAPAPGAQNISVNPPGTIPNVIAPEEPISAPGAALDQRAARSSGGLAPQGGF